MGLRLSRILSETNDKVECCLGVYVIFWRGTKQGEANHALAHRSIRAGYSWLRLRPCSGHACPSEDTSPILILPETLHSKHHLRHLLLIGFALPVGSRLLTNAVGLTTLSLYMTRANDRSTYFHPNTLLRCLSFMPQLEMLVIDFFFPIPNREIERQLTHTLIILPNRHFFRFSGVSAYLEALVHRIITTPRLDFDSAKFWFNDNKVHVYIYPREQAEMDARCFFINVDCWHLDWQVSFMAQIFSSLSLNLCGGTSDS